MNEAEMANAATAKARSSRSSPCRRRAGRSRLPGRLPETLPVIIDHMANNVLAGRPTKQPA